MSTRAPIKKGFSYTGDLATYEVFVGADQFSLIYPTGPIPEKTVDIVTYDVDYNGAPFVPWNTLIPLARGETRSSFDPTSTEPLTRLSIGDISGTVDTFDFIDRVYFTNGVRVNEFVDPAFAIQGLYEYLGRDVPDVVGFNYWLSGYDEKGVSLVTLASDFLRIKSEAAKAGSLSADPQANKDFVLYLYQTILERPGEQQGVDFWANNLDAGLASRAQVLAEFIAVNGETSWHLERSGQTQSFGGWQWIELA